MKDCAVTVCMRREIPCLNRLRSKGCRLTNSGMQQMVRGEGISQKLWFSHTSEDSDQEMVTERKGGEGGVRDQVQIKIDLKHINLKK